MKPIFRSFLATSVMLVAGPLVAQSTPASLVRLNESTLAQLRAKQFERAKLLEPALGKLLPHGLVADHSMKLRNTEVDMYGRTLARYDHYFHGIRVEGSDAVGLLRADGTTERMDYPFTSLLEPPVGVLNASVPQSQAIALAKKAVHLSPGEPSESSSELVLTPIIERQFRAFPTANPGGMEGADPSQSVRVLKGWRLVHIIQHYLPKRSQAFTTSVDAQSGAVLSHGENASCSPGIQGVAQFNRSNGSNIVPLPGSQYGSTYYLQRGGLFSVNIGDVVNPVYSSTSSTFGDGYEYTNGQPASTNGQTQAVDIFYGISSAYDFYLTLFGRHSIDGNDGYFLPIAVHHIDNFAAPAAFKWYRNYVLGQEHYWIDFTDRYDPSNPGGPTELSVTAHEWTHGVNRRCSRVGSDDRDTDEAKAINEASSTIMSTAVRFWDSTGRQGGIGYPDPARWTFDWVYEPQVLGGYPGRPDPVGVEFLYQPSHPYVRGRSEPSWWTYSKAGWTTDVHGIGSPLHRLFYFLTNGASPLTDLNDLSENGRGRTTPFMPLGFDGVGIHNATLIYYLALTQTFTLHMDLLNAGQAIQQAANQRFGAGSSTSRITASALAAVNLASPPAYTFSSNQSHLTPATALVLPSLEHAGHGTGQLAMDSSSEYYQVTIPAGVTLTTATNAVLDLATPSQQGPGIQILDASGTTVFVTVNPIGNPIHHGPYAPTFDPPPDPPDPDPTFVSVSAKATWRNTSSGPITYLVRVFSPQTRAQTVDYNINTRLDIREITSVDSQATLW